MVSNLKNYLKRFCDKEDIEKDFKTVLVNDYGFSFEIFRKPNDIGVYQLRSTCNFRKSKNIPAKMQKR